jgi:hypothetical protein
MADMNNCYEWFDICKAKRVNYVPRGSAYITPDGRFVDLEASGYRTHGALDQALRDNGFPVDPEEMYYLLPIEFMGCIRVNDGKNFLSEVVVDLPATRVTSEQLDSVEKYLDNLPTPEVTVGCTIKGAFQVYNLDEVSSYAIRKKILGFYVSGVLHEGLDDIDDIID